MQSPQQPGIPGLLWVPCTPQVVVNLNVGTAPLCYPAMTPMPPPPPSLPHRQMATTVSTMKPDASNKRTLGPAHLSAEDEKTLIEALRKWKDGDMTLQQVFEKFNQVSIRDLNVLAYLHRDLILRATLEERQYGNRYALLVASGKTSRAS